MQISEYDVDVWHNVNYHKQCSNTPLLNMYTSSMKEQIAAIKNKWKKIMFILQTMKQQNPLQSN